uniref:Uncharacterized protein n=1 Tax=Glossina austeni TaxID=7395 RepID=A0A1A9UI20_GLOAU
MEYDSEGDELLAASVYTEQTVRQYHPSKVDSIGINDVNTVTHARLVTLVEKLPAISGSVIDNITLSISGLLQEVITKMSQASVYRFSNKDPRPIQLTQEMKSEQHSTFAERPKLSQRQEAKRVLCLF